MLHKHTQILIIGSGPSGYTAAIYSARAMFKPILISGVQPGGQLTITTEVENYPGFAQPIQGPWLMDQMREQAENVGVEIVYDTITRAILTNPPFSLESDSGCIYTCDALIIASGSQTKWLDVPGEKTFMGFGVSSCATCDGFFYRGKDVVVVGGGNSAFEEALYLSALAKTVTLIHRSSQFRAERLLQKRVFDKENITILKNTVVEEILGVKGQKTFVSSLRIKNVETAIVTEMPIDGIFIAVGHIPSVQLFEGQLKQKSSGHIWTIPGSSKTNIPGIFAAGDVTDDVYRQAITAAGAGCMAALDAEKYLHTSQEHGSLISEKQDIFF